MDRRRFLLTSLAGALAVPLTAAAQRSGKTYRVGLVHPGPAGPSVLVVDEFRKGLRELGYRDGENIVIDYRFADGMADRLREHASDLVRNKVDVIVAVTSTAAMAAHKETKRIPIVMVNVGDPIRLGLVASLARPSGNVTGTASYLPELSGKGLELLKELVPGTKRVAIFWTPANPLHAAVLKDLDAPARLLAIQLIPIRIMSPDQFEDAFRTAVTDHATAIWILGDSMFSGHRPRLATLAINVRLPTMFANRQHVDAGGLASYGPAVAEMYRRAATYVHKILQGAKPADLPVEQPTKFELVFNLKTAKALGLTIPPSLLARADQVIE